jgi:uncharacterized protein YPO0396
VDALTTLLVPPGRITYNRAAGAEGRERSQLSYILGEHKNVQSEVSGSRKAQYLRQADKDYSVLLATFADEPTGQVVTLAQTFWVKEGKAEKFFVVAEGDLSIVGAFGDFGSELNRLRKRLRDTPGVEVLTSFSEYAERFCRLFGIRQRDTALDLFFQTVSMKSVGNLTDFVRNQMLGRTDVREKIETMTRSFDDLRQAHDAVRNVQDQVKILQELVDDQRLHTSVSAQRQHLDHCRQAVPTYLAYLKVALLKADLHRHNTTLKTLRHELADLDRQTTDRQRELTDLRVALKSDEKGQRLESLKLEIESLETERNKRRTAATAYAKLTQQVDLPTPASAEVFYQNQQQVPALERALEQELTDLKGQRDSLIIRQDAARQQKTDLAAELKSLEGRRTKIPAETIALRQRLLDALDLTEADLPYAGELLRVGEGETDWEGAIERRLRGLGLTLLVRSDQYERVSEWVNRQSLRARLVYNTIPVNYRQQKADIHPLRPSLVNKVDILNSTEFYEWLTDQLLTHHDLTCCETLAEFRQESFAITREGQIKAGRGRHEKDDRTDIRNASQYVLGWSNMDKIRTLRQQLGQAESDFKALTGQVADLDRDVSSLTARQTVLRDLARYTDYTDLDWPATVRLIEQRTAELTQLADEADELKTLQRQMDEAEAQVVKLSERKESKSRVTGQEENKVRQTASELYDAFVTLQVAEESVLQAIFPEHEQLLDTFDTWLTLIDEQPIPADRLTEVVRQTLLGYDDPAGADKGRIRQLASELPKKLDRDIDAKAGEMGKLRDKLIRYISRYRNDFPAESADFSDTMQDIDQYVGRYQLLNDSELARHESRFRELLQQGTIREVALFDTYLKRCEADIAEKINLINEHLNQVDYSTDSYVQLTQDRVRGGAADAIDAFRGELRACLSDSVGEAAYSEAKYLQVKQLLDRLESTRDEDQRWAERVTDVRQWYTFGASERFRETHGEKEFYSDASGKSGGQKEKLAYTILASAIAYQFGLNENRPRTFRFVMIDEAFGRSSDDSTRHGLELFRQLNIQLLIVTPLQKINIIENYINAVHFVSNETGRNSQVRTIDKLEYEQQKARITERRNPL